jgi:hypothetical protein
MPIVPPVLRRGLPMRGYGSGDPAGERRRERRDAGKVVSSAGGKGEAVLLLLLLLLCRPEPRRSVGKNQSEKLDV